MPHAEEDIGPKDTMSNNTHLTNGNAPHSKMLSHLQTYPVFNDSFSAYKSNPWGGKSLSLLRDTYARLIAPLHPYLQTPYSLVSPYLARADELGDTGLTKVDDNFPIFKEDTSKLKQTVSELASVPFAAAGKGKEYVMRTWSDEYKKTQGDDGVVKSVKVLLSTELKIGLDGYALVIGYLNRGKKETNKKVDEIKQ